MPAARHPHPPHVRWRRSLRRRHGSAAVPAPQASSGPATAMTPSTPTSTAARAARIAGSRAGRTSPDVSATGRTTARAAFTRSPAPEASTPSWCAAPARWSSGTRTGSSSDLRSSRPSDRSHTCAVASTSSASPARVIRAAADMISSTSRSDQPRASSPAKTSPTSPARSSPTFSSVCRGAVHAPILARASDIQGIDKEPDQMLNLHLCKLPDSHPKLWRNRRARAQPRNTVCTSPTTSRPAEPLDLHQHGGAHDDDARVRRTADAPRPGSRRSRAHRPRAEPACRGRGRRAPRSSPRRTRARTRRMPPASAACRPCAPEPDPRPRRSRPRPPAGTRAPRPRRPRRTCPRTAR